MAKQSRIGPVITRFYSRLVELAARLLDPDEREAVLGDLCELGVRPGRALREVVGLAVRRQAALWANWRPWVTLFVLILPLSLWLSVISRFASGESSVYLWLYANNLDVALLGNYGFWYELAHAVPIVLAIILKLFCWSWTVGFALALIGPRLPIRRGLVVLVLLLGVSIGAPAYLDIYWRFLGRTLPGLHAESDPISAVWFYRSLFPLFVQTALVIIPSLLGIHSGQLARAFRARWRVAFRALAFVAIAELVWQNRFLWVFRTSHLIWGLESLRAFHMLAWIVYWPLLYLIAVHATRRMPIPLQVRR